MKLQQIWVEFKDESEGGIACAVEGLVAELKRLNVAATLRLELPQAVEKAEHITADRYVIRHVRAWLLRHDYTGWVNRLDAVYDEEAPPSD